MVDTTRVTRRPRRAHTSDARNVCCLFFAYIPPSYRLFFTGTSQDTQAAAVIRGFAVWGSPCSSDTRPWDVLTHREVCLSTLAVE